MEYIRSKSVFVFIMSGILIVLTFLLWQRYSSEVEQFSELQQTLMEQQAYQAAKDIKKQINLYRNQMTAVSLDETWLKSLSSFKKIESIQEDMHYRLRLYFPSMYAFSIADVHGEQIGGDIELFVSGVCQSDISKLAAMFKPDVPYLDYEPYIHPKNGAYHFDMMIPVFIQGQKLVLFMSFKAQILSKILEEHIISEHPIFLVRKDIPDLIEVSSSSVRDEFKRPIRLTKNEMEKIAATGFVDYTKWKVIVLENAEVMNNFKYERRLDMAILFLVLFMFWAAVTWLGLHYENRRGTLLSKLSHQSLHDGLTGLANRRKLNEEISLAIQESRNFHCFSVVLYMDLNDFKAVNDNYGHDVGDDLLIQFANRLKQLTRHQDEVARLGGDEFVVLLKKLGNTHEEVKVAIQDALKRFESKLNANYHLAGINQSVTCIPSIGSVILDNHTQSVDEVLKQADSKMYEQKKSVKNN